LQKRITALTNEMVEPGEQVTLEKREAIMARVAEVVRDELAIVNLPDSIVQVFVDMLTGKTQDNMVALVGAVQQALVKA
jgi:hypothetical protein